MPNRVPDALVDLALETLDDEVKRWRKVPWRPDYVRLIRGPLLKDLDLGPSGAAVTAATEEVMTYHDVPTALADDILLRFAMEKVIETIVETVRPEGLKVSEVA
ncbi:hypothetical protein [Bradyrhizobium phage BDU-MI-1]|nr:hypothetical protein [Bradyrhizobium phage BDU-MI-1]